MSKAEEMIEVYGIGEICLPSERASESGPTECTRTPRGRGTRTEEEGKEALGRHGAASISRSRTRSVQSGGMDRKPRLLAQKLGRMSAR